MTDMPHLEQTREIVEAAADAILHRSFCGSPRLGRDCECWHARLRMATRVIKAIEPMITITVLEDVAKTFDGQPLSASDVAVALRIVIAELRAESG